MHPVPDRTAGPPEDSAPPDVAPRSVDVGGLARVASADGPIVHYHFPVEVEVIGALSDEQVRRLAQHVFDELESALRARV